MKMHKNCMLPPCRTAPFGSDMHQIVCWLGWGFAPDATGGTYIAPPDLLAGWGWGPGEREGGRGGSSGMPKYRVGKPNLKSG